MLTPGAADVGAVLEALVALACPMLEECDPSVAAVPGMAHVAERCDEHAIAGRLGQGA